MDYKYTRFRKPDEGELLSYEELERCFDVKAIDIGKMVEDKVRAIVEYVDKMAIKNIPTETLLKLKKEVDAELLYRGFKNE